MHSSCIPAKADEVVHRLEQLDFPDCKLNVRRVPATPSTINPSIEGQPRRRSRCVSPPTARCCNSSTVAGECLSLPALSHTCIVKRGVRECPGILELETRYLLRGFGRDIKASPINQEVPLPSTDTPVSISHCAAEVPVLL
jgi:hypothetical protein